MSRIYLSFLFFYAGFLGALPSLKKNISIVSHDGLKLSANFFVPKQQKPPYPAVIFCNSWGMSSHQYYLQGIKLAENGYAVLSYSARGWGESEGLVEVGSANDIKDVSAVLDWLEQNSNIDHKNIAMGGLSYGAGIALLGAAHDSRIKTVLSLSGWADLLAALYPNQTPNQAWMKFLLRGGERTGKINPQLQMMYENLIERKNLSEVRQWAQNRSPIEYLQKFNKRQIPIYFSHNTSDFLFGAKDILKFYEKLEGPKRIDINIGIHAMNEMPGLFGFSSFVWGQSYKWLNFWLKGEANGILDQSKKTMQIRNLMKTRMIDPSVETITKFLKVVDGQNFMDGNTHSDIKSIEIYSDFDSRASIGIPIFSALLDTAQLWPIRLKIANINPRYGKSFLSPQTPVTRILAGSPTLELEIIPHSAKFQLIAYLYTVNSWGTATLVSHAPLTRYNAEIGFPTNVKFEFHTSTAVVPKGSRMGLVIDTQDPLYMHPTEEAFSLEILLGSKSSILHIPFVE